MDLGEGQEDADAREFFPGSYIRELYVEQVKRDFYQVFNFRHMEKLYNEHLRAYFPLNNQNHPGDRFSFTSKDSVDNVMIKVAKEGANNDICKYGIIPSKVLKIAEKQMFEPMQISRSLRRKKYYEYSFNTWIKIDPSTSIEPRSYYAVRDAFIVKHEEVFALYLSNRNEMKAFFMALKPYYEKSSRGVFVPYNEWINIRLRMNMSFGYILEVYSESNPLNPISSTASSVRLKDQRPGKDFYLFDNFVGEVRSMAYWEDDYLD